MNDKAAVATLRSIFQNVFRIGAVCNCVVTHYVCNRERVGSRLNTVRVKFIESVNV